MAAEGDGAGALSSLATMYETGRGVQRYHFRAYALLSMAVDQGFTYDAAHRERVAKKLNPGDIIKAQQLARECAKKNYKDCGS